MFKPSLSISLVAVTLSGAADKITYDDHIFPIFESKCLNCHNPDKKKGDLDLSTYTGTMAGSSGGKIALSGDGGSSKLFTVTVHTEEPVMPPEGDKIAKKDADLIRTWIDGGLLENKGSKAKKRPKPAFTLGSIPTGKRPEGPPPMPQDLLLEPVVTPTRSTVVADMDASPWAPLLAVTGQKQILLYHSDTLELIGVLPFPKGNPETISFHPSGKYLIAGGGIGGKSGTTVTWDITNGKEMMTMGKEFDSVLAADLRADLGGIALGGPSRLIKLWDTQEGEPLKSIKQHTDWVTAIAYSPDGVLLATGCRGNGVQIWEAATGNEFHSLRGHQKAIVDIKWRADSNLVATASEDGTIRFWDMNQGKEVKRGTASGGGILALDYARNGKLICSTRDGRVKLWKADLT
ncbi:MAG: c-type cytochrome domain-containing protein, partial [Akkermansiaceae bacterium]